MTDLLTDSVNITGLVNVREAGADGLFELIKLSFLAEDEAEFIVRDRVGDERARHETVDGVVLGDSEGNDLAVFRDLALELAAKER